MRRLAHERVVGPDLQSCCDSLSKGEERSLIRRTKNKGTGGRIVHGRFSRCAVAHTKSSLGMRRNEKKYLKMCKSLVLCVFLRGVRAVEVSKNYLSCGM